MKRYFFLIVMVTVFGFGLPNAGVAAGSETFIQVMPATMRSIDGISRLDRAKYFNVCSPGWNQFIDATPFGDGEYLVNDLKVSFGRALNLMTAFASEAREDPLRPGYVDPDWYQSISRISVPEDDLLRQRFSGNLDVILHGRQGKFPSFMDQLALDVPVNLDAAAEYLVEGFKARFDDYTRPAYWELVNEPKWATLPHPQFHQLHAEVAHRVRQEGLPVLVGGPCMSVGYFFRGTYGGNWENGLKRFIDNVGQDVDFISFHVYDYYQGNGFEDITTGLPLESVFDLVEAYTLRQLGEVKPIAFSEHGATGRLFSVASEDPSQLTDRQELQAQASRSLLKWWHMNSLNGQVMTFLDRPTTVLKAVPFTLVTTDSWNPRYLWSLYTREDFDRNRPYYATELIQFYQLWKDVEGFRVRAHSSDPDVQVRAFVSADYLYLAVNNLADEQKSLRLDLSGSRPAAAHVSRLYFDESQSVFEQHLPLSYWEQLSLRPDETVVVRFQYDDSREGWEMEQLVEETTYYSEELVVPIEADRRHAFSFALPMDVPYAYANLRVGVSRPHDLSWQPQIWINGHRLDVLVAASDSKQLAGPEYASVKQAVIPVEYLDKETTIEVAFHDSGGAIGAVALVAASEQPLLPYYEESVLPKQFITVASSATDKALDPSNIVLSWQPAEGASHYRLLIAADEEFSQVLVDQQLEKPEFTIDSLAYGGTYYWKVRAISAAEAGARVDLQRWNQDGVQTITTKPALSPPIAPTITNVSDGLGHVAVTWQGVEYADAYRVYRRPVGEKEWTIVGHDLTRHARRYEEQAPLEQSFVYAVTAVNHHGESAFATSEEVFLRQPNVLAELDFLSDIDCNWRLTGPWSHAQGTAHLNAVFPRPFGSISATDLLTASYVLETRVRIDAIGDERMAAIRLTTSAGGQDRYQIIYWVGRGTWELMKRTAAGSQTLASTSYRLEEGQWHALRWAVRNGALEFSIDDNIVVSVVDFDPLTGGDLELYVANMQLSLTSLVAHGN